MNPNPKLQELIVRMSAKGFRCDVKESRVIFTRRGKDGRTRGLETTLQGVMGCDSRAVATEWSEHIDEMERTTT